MANLLGQVSSTGWGQALHRSDIQNVLRSEALIQNLSIDGGRRIDLRVCDWDEYWGGLAAQAADLRPGLERLGRARRQYIGSGYKLEQAGADSQAYFGGVAGEAGMVKVTLIDRKGKALTPSSLRCLSHLPTINMTAGCVHGCAYCYIRGYSQYPGDEAVVVYRNTAQQVERELQSKIMRQKPLPGAVYFCPSSDAFMPVEEVLEQSYRTMRLLLDQNIGVQFVTKGAIPARFLALFAARPELVAGQIGLTTLDDELNARIEPQAAPAARRLHDLGKLIDIGVSASLRADPLIHGVTDDAAGLDALFSQAVKRGVRDVSASYLFLRPAIVGSLRRSIHDQALLRRIQTPYENAGRLCFQGRGNNGQSSGISLPIEIRRAELERLCRMAERHGLSLRLCGCKNGDLTNSRCHLTNLTVMARGKKHAVGQASLW